MQLNPEITETRYSGEKWVGDGTRASAHEVYTFRSACGYELSLNMATHRIPATHS